MRDTSFLVFPIVDHAFFEKTQFQSLFGHNLLQVAGFATQVLHFIRCGSTRGVPGKPLLPGFQELLRPVVIKALDNAFPTAQFCTDCDSNRLEWTGVGHNLGTLKFSKDSPT